MSEDKIQELFSLFPEASDHDKGEIAFALGDFDGEHVVSFLTELLKHENIRVQMNAEKSLNRIEKRKLIRQKQELDAKKAKLNKKNADDPREFVEELLSPEEIERIRKEEFDRIQREKEEAEKRIREEKEKRLREEEEMEKLREEMKRDEERRKAENLIRQQVRRELSEQEELIKFEGKMITRAEMEEILEERRKEKDALDSAKRRKRERIKSQQDQERDKILQHLIPFYIKMFDYMGLAFFAGLLFYFLNIKFFGNNHAIFTLSLIVVVMGFIFAVYGFFHYYDSLKKLLELRIVDVDNEITLSERILPKHYLADLLTGMAKRSDKQIGLYFLPEDEELRLKKLAMIEERKKQKEIEKKMKKWRKESGAKKK